MDLALLTASGRLTRPICFRFIFDGFGSFATHPGTGDPDCNSTFAMLKGGLSEGEWQQEFQRTSSRFQEWRVIIREVRNSFPLPPCAPSTS